MNDCRSGGQHRPGMDELTLHEHNLPNNIPPNNAGRPTLDSTESPPRELAPSRAVALLEDSFAGRSPLRSPTDDKDVRD